MASNLPDTRHLALHAHAFDLKGFKTWEGRDGVGYQFTLTHEGVAVAQVTEHGNGGCLRVDWHGLTAGPAATPAQRKKAAAQAAQTGKALAALASILASLPDIDLGHGIVVKANEDNVLGSLTEVVDLRKLVKRKTVFAEGDKVYTMNTPYTAAVATLLAGKYPRAVVLNTLAVYA